MSDLVGNPEDRVSCVAALLSLEYNFNPYFGKTSIPQFDSVHPKQCRNSLQTVLCN